jgi:hypothetical protein
MEDMAGGVEVSFGEPDAGGATDISQVANTTSTSPSNPSESTSESEDPVVTSDDVDQPEVDNTQKQTPKTTTDPVKDPVKNEEPTISQTLKEKLAKLKRDKEANSNKTTSTGDGEKTGPKGDPGAKQKGPGGSIGGDGPIGHQLYGIGISNSPNITKPVGHDGKVIISFQVNAKAELIVSSMLIEIGTTGDLYLKDLSKENLKKFKFHKIGGNNENRRSTITFNYTQ